MLFYQELLLIYLIYDLAHHRRIGVLSRNSTKLPSLSTRMQWVLTVIEGFPHGHLGLTQLLTLPGI